MHKKYLGPFAIVVLALINVGLWLIVPPANDGSAAHFARQLLSEMVGTTSIILMACSLVLATRARVLEPYFGGLDKMYKAHRTTALAAMALLLGHAVTVSHVSGGTHMGKQLGSLALLGFLALTAFSVAPRLLPSIALAYERWRLVHRLNGVLFVVSLAHALLVNPLADHSSLIMSYYLVIALIGAAAYLYQTLLARFIRTSHPYIVAGVRKLNATALEITLAPQRRQLAFAAGQFLYVRFEGAGPLTESHPFTVSSSPRESTLRLAIKASGDYTRHLYAHLKEGMRATVEGSYGMFTYTGGGPRQVWIAGGIGITPFLSWMRDLDGSLERDIAFFYVVRTPADALYLEEIKAAAKRHAGLRAHVWYSAHAGPLTGDTIAAACEGAIADRDIYMCGPGRMIETFEAQFRRLGVPARQIHYEEFNFR